MNVDVKRTKTMAFYKTTKRSKCRGRWTEAWILKFFQVFRTNSILGRPLWKRNYSINKAKIYIYKHEKDLHLRRQNTVKLRLLYFGDCPLLGKNLDYVGEKAGSIWNVDLLQIGQIKLERLGNKYCNSWKAENY